MRTPPNTRTWGIEGCEIVISQSRRLTADELYEHFDWRGIELVDGYLMPKGAELSLEEIALDQKLCAIAEPKLDAILAGRADNLGLKGAKSQEIGFTVGPANAGYLDETDNLEVWSASGYREVWRFSPWYRCVDIYTAPRQYRTLLGGEILPGLDLPIAEIFED